MLRKWTLSGQIAASFALMFVMVIAIGLIGTLALRNVVASKDSVITVDGPFLLAATQLQTTREQTAGTFRSYLLNGTPEALEQLMESRREFNAKLDQIASDANTDAGRRLIAEVRLASESYIPAVDRMIALHRGGMDLAAVLQRARQDIVPHQIELDSSIVSLLEERQQRLEDASLRSSEAAQWSVSVILAVGIAGAVIATGLAFLLSRVLSLKIASSVNQVRSASSELQAAANQQATGVKEQVTSLAEINTTITELLATSRQIAESAQRVTEIAEETAAAAGSGDGTVEQTSEALAGIRSQFDLVVSHMVDLGKKSQKISAVLDIVSELAEQTNILSINAAIEAAGAGEAGRRFGTVAEEIRKLADRVTGSAREVRSLIDDVQSSVNTTVMATEGGSKTVIHGAKQFEEVTKLFHRIGELVVTTTEAAREIELSTKQQSTAVEQVNIAIHSVSQAARETEASAGQTSQTATELSSMSRELLRLVQAQPATR